MKSTHTSTTADPPRDVDSISVDVTLSGFTATFPPFSVTLYELPPA